MQYGRVAKSVVSAQGPGKPTPRWDGGKRWWGEEQRGEEAGAGGPDTGLLPRGRERSVGRPSDREPPTQCSTAATSPSTREPPGPSESSPALPGPWAGAELPVHRLTAGFSLSPHKLPSRWYPDSQASVEDGAAVLLRVAEINSHHLSLTAASAPFSKCCGKGSLWLLWPCLSPAPGWGPAVLTAGPQQQCRLPSPPHTGSPTLWPFWVKVLHVTHLTVWGTE